MSLEKCSNCGGLIELTHHIAGGPLWQHPPSHTRASCNNPVPGLGLIETIQLYYAHPLTYAIWAGTDTNYTEYAILHGLRMQATIHWNNCSNAQCKNCQAVGKDTADRYMIELGNGRHDLHPSVDSKVHMLAFEIHDAAIEARTHNGRGRPGIMTCTYVVSHGSSEACACYELAYQRWLKEKPEDVGQVLITPIDLDDLYYEPRYE